MSSEMMSLLAVFGVVFLGCFVILQVVLWRRDGELRRLKAASEPGGLDSSPDLILGEVTPALAQQLPIGEDKKGELTQELIQAGFYSPTAVQDYAAVRVVLVVVPLFLAGVLALIVPPSMVLYALMMGLIVAAMGYSLPRVYVNMMGKTRRMQIEKGLPVAVDLLALGLLSGQNIIAALFRVTKEIQPAFPALAQELDIVRQQAELNTLPHALSQFADRVQIPQVRNLVIILTQSQRQGTDVATALMEFVNNYRISMRQEADKQANQASFWLIFPSIFFLWLPAFAVLVAPVLFEMGAKRDMAREQMEKNVAKMKDLNDKRMGKRPAPSDSSEDPTD
jgi:tight adherence protein C